MLPLPFNPPSVTTYQYWYWRSNAACEGFFGRLKAVLLYPRDWRAATVEQFIKEVDSYIRWYNEKRIKISLGSLSPIEYRQSPELAT